MGLVNANVIYINIANKDILKVKMNFTCEQKQRAACAAPYLILANPKLLQFYLFYEIDGLADNADHVHSRVKRR